MATPGVALKPPVPQPQLKYSPSTSVLEIIGDASGKYQLSPQCRSIPNLERTGNNSTAEIMC